LSLPFLQSINPALAFWIIGGWHLCHFQAFWFDVISNSAKAAILIFFSPEGNFPPFLIYTFFSCWMFGRRSSSLLTFCRRLSYSTAPKMSATPRFAPAQRVASFDQDGKH
jgi:hypothetical protein